MFPRDTRSSWKNIIKTTIIAYVIACAIPGGITGVFLFEQYLFLDHLSSSSDAHNPPICLGISIPEQYWNADIGVSNKANRRIALKYDQD